MQKLSWLSTKTHTEFVHFALSEAVQDRGRERVTKREGGGCLLMAM